MKLPMGADRFKYANFVQGIEPHNRKCRELSIGCDNNHFTLRGIIHGGLKVCREADEMAKSLPQSRSGQAFEILVACLGESGLHRELSHRLPEIYDVVVKVGDNPQTALTAAIYQNNHEYGWIGCAAIAKNIIDSWTNLGLK